MAVITRTTRRAAAGMLIVAAALALGSATPAGAAELPVSGSYTGGGYYLWGACQGGAIDNHDGSGEWGALGPITFHVEVCVLDPGDVDEPWPVAGGSFTIVAADGTLTGSVSGQFGTSRNDGWWAYEHTLTVTGGTDAYEGASGSIALDGELEYVFPVGRNIRGTVSGTVTVPDPTPTSKDDCKDSGWGSLVDDAGAAFANQGRCVAWAEHNLP